MMRSSGRCWKRLTTDYLQYTPRCTSEFLWACSPIRSITSPNSAALQVGAMMEKTQAFNSHDVAVFTALTGDSNPIHSCPEAAAAALAGSTGCVLPGMMCASLFPAIIGSAFTGAVYLSQTVKFRRPAQVADPVKARVTVERVSGSRVSFKTECFSTDGELLLDGAAIALIPAASS